MQAEQTKVQKFMTYVTGVLDILICLLLFISAMYKGSFYKEDTLFINMIICILGLVCLAVKLVLNIRDSNIITKSKLTTLIDIGVIALAISYFLPIIFNTKASMESALFECTRYVNLAIIYYIVRSSKNKNIYLTTIVGIAIVVAALGIDEITYRSFESALNTFSMGYLTQNSGRIASTIQYANITALLMLVASIILEKKIITNISKIKEQKVTFSAFVAFEMFSLILIETAIILTGSRMNVFLMIVSSIIYAIYLFKEDKKRNTLTILLLTFVPFVLVTSIDSYLLVQDYFMVILTYVLTFVISTIYVVAYKLFNTNNKYQKNNKERLGKKYNKVLILSVSLVCLIVGIGICSIPKAFVVKDDTDTGINVSRNIYGDFHGEYELNLRLKVEGGEKYSLNLYEIDNEFNKHEIAYILPKDIVDGKYNTKIHISENVQKLQLVVNVTRCKVTVDSLKIGDEKTTLSYMFLPDNLVFRLKDTITKDSNNTLRLVYYKDGMKLFKLSPIVGHGGEGFKSRYQEVQETPYISSEIHSVPLQILVEAGIIGLTIYILIVVVTYILIFKLMRNKNKNGIIYLLIFSVYIVTSLFDLVFSFGIMITLFGVIIGLIVNEYKERHICGKDKYELDNKSMLGMAKIATLSICLMSLVVVTNYSIKMYKASMIQLPAKEEQTLSASYERVGILEEKIKLDEYNVQYLTNILDEYKEHISILNSIYVETAISSDKEILKNEINSYIIRQKEVADKLIDIEYYNKYVLDKVARCYFDNYVSYSKIYEDSFKNKDIAYVFYVGYGIKLTKRLDTVGPLNKTALGLQYNIYNEYIPSLEKQNNIINSSMLMSAINDMKSEFEKLKEKLD